MTTASDLVTVAEAVLAGTGSQRNRMACWITRSALEAVTADLLAAKGLDTAHASMRSKLLCLEVAYADAPAVFTRLHYAWARLSEACHQHSYELSPTHAEVAHLMWLVQSLEEAI
jgi:hypothetical protein